LKLNTAIEYMNAPSTGIQPALSAREIGSFAIDSRDVQAGGVFFALSQPEYSNNGFDEAAFDAAYTFLFSPRPGTPAAGMTDDAVAPEVAQERMVRLTEVVERHALAHHRARIGQVEEVLVEGPSKKDPTRRSGRTRQGKLVHFDADEADAPSGASVHVEVTYGAPHWLAGDLVRDDRGRLRIPVAAA
jgi:hypothetical protein